MTCNIWTQHILINIHVTHKKNCPGETDKTNPRRTLAQNLTLSTGDRGFDTILNSVCIVSPNKNLKQNKAPGHDMIGTKIIKLCPEIFANILEKNYNRAIEMGIYPDDMKIV